ncbi:hypothetical protein CEP48_06995 [Mergibacter septicus]|uniref:Uncharacterized protein n=1 Tax=Mergibacter septicus TaxID=221402 RepID=A0A8E3MHD8_9PAST|nr:DUF535 family protein [Mergibacter septicus]AWX15940.1 hypothetical protein CEP47_06995 [Mergibacter septicus]QDJ13416.1 hypothetical protein CEP45_05915 [Mergibacter septicus]QDJ15193.1 hypothetical protein CEP48_06995 [Mergibacter septicus]WMR95434.1 DUF535 family protein [Mergibacter septicus]
MNLPKTPIFIYPERQQLFHHSTFFSLENLKYSTRKFLHRKAVQKFETMVNQQELWKMFFRHNPYACYTVLHSYASKHFTPQQRVEALETDLSSALIHFGETSCEQVFCQNKPLKLAQLTDDIALYLHKNDLCLLEALWSVSLRDKEMNRLYNCTFVFLSQSEILLTSVQGGGSKEEVRDLTKQLHGLRPMQLMVNIMQLFASHLGCTALYGIPQNLQVKLRRFKRNHVLFSYDDFWQEFAGKKQHNPIRPFFILPLSATRKAFDEISSKKRAMYRRRYQMLDQASAAILTFLSK